MGELLFNQKCAPCTGAILKGVDANDERIKLTLHHREG